MTGPTSARQPAATLLALLDARGLSLACAESLTGGLVAAEITAVPGASRCFRGAVVAYATEAKSAVLGVPAQLLALHGPVARPTAAAMARAAADTFGADLGLATTGVAGPDPVGAVPVGRVYLAAFLVGRSAVVRRMDLAGDRERVRRASVLAVLELGLEELAASAVAGNGSGRQVVETRDESIHTPRVRTEPRG